MFQLFSDFSVSARIKRDNKRQVFQVFSSRQRLSSVKIVFRHYVNIERKQNYPPHSDSFHLPNQSFKKTSIDNKRRDTICRPFCSSSFLLLLYVLYMKLSGQFTQNQHLYFSGSAQEVDETRRERKNQVILIEYGLNEHSTKKDSLIILSYLGKAHKFTSAASGVRAQ